MISDYLKTLPQYLLPHHALSRLVGVLVHMQQPALKNKAINLFIKHYGVDMAQAENPDPRSYPDFHHFFIRKLRDGARPIAENTSSIMSPADGAVSQIGDIKQGRIFQAKGRDFSLSELLGGSKTHAQLFIDGHFTTIYLSPKDYHRVHMPYGGKLTDMIHVPGRLFSVNPATTRTVPKLFARNERVVCLFDTNIGPMAVIMVGAMICASIHTKWAGKVTPPHGKKVQHTSYTDKNITLKKGDEMGFFTLGSTAIVLFAKDAMVWNDDVHADSKLMMGQTIASH